MARDYSKGKVYCIKVNTKEEYLPYVGSTTKQYLSQRIEKHHYSFKQWLKNPQKNKCISSYKLFIKFGVKNCYIELLELFPCKCNEELLKKEREWFDKIECCNKVKPLISEKEKVEYFKNYRQEHLEHIKEKDKKYCAVHKDQKKEYDKEYAKKIEVIEKRKEPYTCICGSTIRKDAKIRHQKSKKHQDFIKNNLIIDNGESL